jgi:hypothetical protein
VRKLVMLLGVAMFMLVVAAGVAVAVEKTCDSIPCNGTENDDELHEREGSVRDRIRGFQGEDLLDANNYRQERDVLVGGQNGDRLLTNDNDGRDSARGGKGSDRCVVDNGDNTSSCITNIEAAGVHPAGFN